MSYGTSPYGTSPYGGVAAQLTIVDALAVSTNTVRVTLSKPPQQTSPLLTGDVFNPNTWQVFNQETGGEFTVLSVSEHDAPLIFDITVLQFFASFQVIHRVQSTTLVDQAGSLIDTPNFFDFVGVLDVERSTLDQLAARQRINTRDLRNLPAPMSSVLGGSLNIGSDGDYEQEDGVELVRKLIFRRMVTTPGGFFHLPNYGLGIRVKEPLLVNDIPKFKAEIVRQVLLEPEVESAVAKVQFTPATGSLIIRVSARLTPSGQQITVPLEIPLGGVEL